MKGKLPFLLLIFLYISESISAQERVISGTVTAQDDGLVVPGVNVILKGTTIGTTTDVKGLYSLKVPEKGGKLVFSSIGFIIQEIEIGLQSSISAVLVTDNQTLSEVVVTAFGIQRETKALGYSVQEIGGKQLTEARAANVVNGLSGKIAGVRISPNSGPGSGSTIQVRGPATVGSYNQPLIVIDGVPIEQQPQAFNKQFGGGLSEINPDNIATISVLKGPSATALYGSRGQNGVLLVTTKNGSGTQRIGLEVNTNVTFERPYVKPQFQNIYGGGNGYRTWYSDGWSGTITNPQEIAQYRAVYPSYWSLAGTEGTDESWGSPMDGRLVRQWWTGTDVAPLTPQPNNWNDFWNTGSTVTTHVALNGSNDKGNFRLAIGKMKQNGIMYYNDYSRTNIRLNAGYHLTNKLSTTLSAEYIQSGSDNRNYTSGSEFIWSHRQTDWNKIRDWRQYATTHIQRQVAGKPADTNPPNWQHTFFSNPYYLQEFTPLSNAKDRLIGNFALTYKPLDGLSMMLRSGTDLWTDTRILVLNFERVRNGNRTPGTYSEEVLRAQETNTDVIANYTRNLTPDFSLGVMAGVLTRNTYYKRNYALVRELVVDGVYNLSNSVPSTNSLESSIEKSESQSVFGSLQLGWRNALFMDITARNDWSSTLPAANRSYFYPSVALSAVLTDLLDISSNVLSFAKVRASYARVGNDTRPYRLTQNYRSVGSWNGNVAEYAESNVISNPSLKPEITTGNELGVDVRFFQNRLGIDITYYNQTTRNQILDIEVPKSSGYDRKFINAGSIHNQGIEVALTGTAISLANSFKWEIGLNFARNRNQVQELAEGLTTYPLNQQNGLYSEARVNEAYGALVGVAFARSPEGKIIYANGLPTVAPDVQILGNIQPDWTGGWQNTLSFKGITLAALVDARMGGQIFDLGTGIARWTGQYAETAVGREEGLIGNGVKNIGTTDQPQYVPNDIVVAANQLIGFNNPRRYHEAGIFDASFIKLREVSIGYTIPTAFSQKFFIQTMKISIVGRNVAILFKNHPHIDPEVDRLGSNQQGFAYGELPVTRSLGFNVNLEF